MTTHIYALKDTDGNIRYVGKAVNPANRLAVHISTARHQGMEFTEERKRHISEAKRGVYPEALQRPEVMAKCAAATAEANRSRIWSDESRKKASAAKTGKKMAEDVKMRIGHAMKSIKTGLKRLYKADGSFTMIRPE